MKPNASSLGSGGAGRRGVVYQALVDAERLVKWLRGRRKRAQINWALSTIPVAYREVVVLRELEDLSYKDIGRIADITGWHRDVATGAQPLRRILAGQLRPQPAAGGGNEQQGGG